MQTKVLSNFEKIDPGLGYPGQIYVISTVSHSDDHASILTDICVTFVFLGEIQIHNEKQ